MHHEHLSLPLSAPVFSLLCYCWQEATAAAALLLYVCVCVCFHTHVHPHPHPHPHTHTLHPRTHSVLRHLLLLLLLLKRDARCIIHITPSLFQHFHCNRWHAEPQPAGGYCCCCFFFVGMPTVAATTRSSVEGQGGCHK